MKSANPIRFRTTILAAGKTATGIQIPDEIIARLGAGKKPAVRITMNGYTHRSTVAVVGGRFMVGVNAENRQKAKVAGGDVVDAGIALDTEPLEVTVPADFAEPSTGNPRCGSTLTACPIANKKPSFKESKAPRLPKLVNVASTKQWLTSVPL